MGLAARRPLAALDHRERDRHAAHRLAGEAAHLGTRGPEDPGRGRGSRVGAALPLRRHGQAGALPCGRASHHRQPPAVQGTVEIARLAGDPARRGAGRPGDRAAGVEHGQHGARRLPRGPLLVQRHRAWAAPGHAALGRRHVPRRRDTGRDSADAAGRIHRRQGRDAGPWRPPERPRRIQCDPARTPGRPASRSHSHQQPGGHPGDTGESQGAGDLVGRAAHRARRSGHDGPEPRGPVDAGAPDRTGRAVARDAAGHCNLASDGRCAQCNGRPLGPGPAAGVRAEWPAPGTRTGCRCPS
jgi:hypothetical protein